MRKNFLTRNMEAEFQSHEDCKLRGEEVASVEPEDGLGLLDHRLKLVSLAVVQLGCKNKAGPRAELPVHLVDDVFQNKLLKVNISLGKKQSQIEVTDLFTNFTWAIVTVSMEHSRPILRISTLMLRSLLRVIWA